MSFGRVEAATLAAIVCGATLGFLRHNYHPAKIFMGDTGALTLGFVLGSLAVEGVLKTPATIALAAPLLIMAVPILDTSFVVAKRLKYRRRPWAPDQNHFYHRFMRIGAEPAQDRGIPAPVGGGARRLRDAAALRTAAPARPLGRRQRADLRDRRALRHRRLGLHGLRARDPQGAAFPMLRLRRNGSDDGEEEDTVEAVEQLLEAHRRVGRRGALAPGPVSR